MNRTDIVNIVEAALTAGLPAYARQAAQRYLEDWPGDLRMGFALARAHAAEDEPSLAASALEALVAADPEDYRAYRMLGEQLLRLNDQSAAAHAFACAHVGDGLYAPGQPPAWASAARTAYLAERIGDWEMSRRESAASLEADPKGRSPLPALLHLCSFWHAGQLDAARLLAGGFHSRWPQVVAFQLCLAECLMARDDQPRAIALLHDAATQDVGRQVVTRHWGATHPYGSLWEANTSAPLPGPLPGQLVNILGLNMLAKPTSPRPYSAAKGEAVRRSHTEGGEAGVSDEIADIQAQLDALAKKLPSKTALKYRLWRMSGHALSLSSRPAGRVSGGLRTGKPAGSPTGHASRQSKRAKRGGQPASTSAHYVILSSRTRLQRAFGTEGYAAIDALMHTLMQESQRQTGMHACVIYVDDPASLSPYGLRPVNPANAWDIKMLIGKLAGRLKDQKSEIGALLIVGGAEIIPFHHLPNPTDDADADIPSDNPYATSDDNYFVPEWPVGRMPSGAGKDPTPILRALRTAASDHRPPDEARTAGSGDLRWHARLRHWWRRWWAGRRAQRSFGYSANVWKDASAAVYNLIGDPREMLTSPPMEARALPRKGLAPSRLSYFNLHGIEDGPEWFGQRGMGQPPAGESPHDFIEEYPVALRPEDVVNSGRAPMIVFSEACYGANILGKTTDEALCLRFLHSGSRVVVGSTKIAYGSVATPLIGADLLGRHFWHNLSRGLPAAEALRRAKLQLAQEMHRRQGFLDGEDQKSVISFILYGDPLATVPSSGRPRAVKHPSPVRLPAPPPIVCDRVEGSEPTRNETDSHAAPAIETDMPPEVVARIKAIVEKYLPDMRGAHARVAHSHAVCAGVFHDCPTAQLSKIGKARPVQAQPRTTVVILSKTIRAGALARAHPHYARVTLDENGSVLKLAVSR